jgi:hypothetical protein
MKKLLKIKYNTLLTDNGSLVTGKTRFSVNAMSTISTNRIFG